MIGLPRLGPVQMIAGVAAAVLAFGAAGCGDPEPVVWPDDPSSEGVARQPSSMGDPAEAEATEEILAVYSGFRQLEVEAYTNPQPPHIARQQLSVYLADPLLSRTLGTLDTMLRAGVVFEGRPTWQPVVAELRLDETPPTATIRDCVDASGWRSVFEETGEPVASDDLPDHYVMSLDAKLFSGGWLLHDAAMEEDEQC